jgi:hypothetical protein
VLRWVAAVSGIYDVGAGLLLLLAPGALARALGATSPGPALLGDLTGLFALAVGVGYLVALRDLERHRAFLWIMGPLLKGLGAAAFVRDHLVRGSPRAILAFAAADGALALLTLVALRRERPPSRA